MAAAGYKQRLNIIATGIALFVGLYLWVSPRIGFAGYGRQHFFLQDYAYHIILTRHFWFVESGDIYNLDYQLKALTAYLGRPAVVTMPVGVTPLAFIVWLPFAAVAGFSLALSYSLWVACSLTLLGLALQEIYAGLRPPPSRWRLPWILCGITIFSAVGASAVVVGQTSFFAAGLLSLLLYRVARRGREQKAPFPDWRLILLIVLSGLKPPYLIIGLGILWIYGRKRELLISMAAVLALTAALTPLLTVGWPWSYLRLLGMYSSGAFPEIYAWSVVPRTMNIFRSAVSGLIGDRTAALASTVICALIFSGIGLLSLPGPWRDTVGRLKRVIALIAGCLLFAPNWGAYEDILLIPLFIAVLMAGRPKSIPKIGGPAIAAGLFICLLHPVSQLLTIPLRVFFLFKLMVLAALLYYADGEAGVPKAGPI